MVIALFCSNEANYTSCDCEKQFVNELLPVKTDKRYRLYRYMSNKFILPATHRLVNWWRLTVFTLIISAREIEDSLQAALVCMPSFILDVTTVHERLIDNNDESLPSTVLLHPPLISLHGATLPLGRYFNILNNSALRACMFHYYITSDVGRVQKRLRINFIIALTTVLRTTVLHCD